jgi:hypothetical protein
VSKGEEDTLSCFLFLYQCICVGQPSILLAFSFLEMRGPMFRWSGRFWQTALRLCQVVCRRFRWCINLGLGFHTYS